MIELPSRPLQLTKKKYQKVRCRGGMACFTEGEASPKG